MPATNKKRFFRYGWRIIFAANLVFILLMFMAYLAWYVSPEKMSVFAYVGLAFPFILAINTTFVILWLLCRQWLFLAVSVVTLLVCINPVTAYFPLHIAKTSPPDGCIKILTYNVRCFNWFNKGKDAAIFDYIRNSEADIVCIQEFLAMRGNGRVSVEEIQKQLKNYPYYKVINQRPTLPYIYGIACFSKYPIMSAEVIPYKSENGSAVFLLYINGKRVSLINNHLESNGVEPKDRELYQDFLKNVEKSKIDDVTRNMRAHLGKAFRKRAFQAEKIAEFVKKQQTDAIILCGDFNDTPISYAYHTIKGDLLDAYSGNEFGARITYHEDFFLFRIDFIMHSDNIRSYNCTIDKVNYSDHYPMWTYLKIDDE
ncbi:MAG: endonuclease/exonuclease/phosphatase family protein [Prevotella sp.]|jgi:endonuclease/exonuclease/phosphatase family metal-dependent hydrolase|nr:endonuclease/exonuclease/phosphatase family protein [Prevotella sp.]